MHLIHSGSEPDFDGDDDGRQPEWLSQAAGPVPAEAPVELTEAGRRLIALMQA